MHTLLTTASVAHTPSNPAPISSRSPWGKIQDCTTIADGIYNVGTARHGGFKLNRSRNAQVPPCVRNPGGWYEEDCEWCWVAITYPNHFAPDQLEWAKAIARNQWPDEYLKIFGGTLDPSQSRELRRRAFLAATREQYVVRSAVGDWAPGVPEGKVGVLARKASTGEERSFLVDVGEYESRNMDGLGFVIDEARHVRTEGVG